MAEIPRTAVTSLHQAMRALLQAPQGRRNIVVPTVRVEHASAMQELLRVQSAGKEWTLENKGRLRNISVADGLLAIMEGAVLSVLIDRTTDRSILRLLRRYAHGIKSCAGEVGGGTFQRPVERLCDDLLHHVNEGRRQPRRYRRSWLLQNAQGL